MNKPTVAISVLRTLISVLPVELRYSFSFQSFEKVIMCTHKSVLHFRSGSSLQRKNSEIVLHNLLSLKFMQL